MIEQLVNFWNSLDVSSKCMMGILTGILIFIIFILYNSTIGEALKDKRKSTTQKYREGLIKK